MAKAKSVLADESGAYGLPNRPQTCDPESLISSCVTAAGQTILFTALVSTVLFPNEIWRTASLTDRSASKFTARHCVWISTFVA